MINVALTRYRVFRFTDDLYLHSAIDEIERKLLQKNRLDEAAIDALSKIDRALRSQNKFTESLQRKIAVDYYGTLDEVELPPVINKSTNVPSLLGAVHIVAPPRSGTTLLYNALAGLRKYSYFTSDSHHYWGCTLMKNSKKKWLEKHWNEYENQKSKTLRTDSRLMLPSEAEHIFDRVAPVYQHINAHEYNISNAASKSSEGDLFKNCIQEHVIFFQRPLFLTKSPFNAFRISYFEEQFKCTNLFVDIIRDRASNQKSVMENNFLFKFPDDQNAHFLERWRSWKPEIKPTYVFECSFDKLISAPNTIAMEITNLLDTLIKLRR